MAARLLVLCLNFAFVAMPLGRCETAQEALKSRLERVGNNRLQSGGTSMWEKRKLQA
jgi:hypothetical protein